MLAAACEVYTTIQLPAGKVRHRQGVREQGCWAGAGRGLRRGANRQWSNEWGGVSCQAGGSEQGTQDMKQARWKQEESQGEQEADLAKALRIAVSSCAEN